MFQNSASFIKAPKLWCAFIGGLLHRYITYETENKDIIIINDSMFPTQNSESETPSDIGKRYLYNVEAAAIGKSVGHTFGGLVMAGKDKDDRGEYYPVIDRGLQALPAQAKNEFIRIFKDFALGEEFKTITDSYELFNSVDDLYNKTNTLMGKKKKLLLRQKTFQLKSLAQQNFLKFVKQVWPEFVEGPHHIKIAEKFQAFSKKTVLAFVF